MRRPTLLFATVVLSLATAGVLASAAWLLPVGATPAAPTGGEETARRFYGAVNDTIATGEVGPLRAVVAADFVAVDALPDIGAGRAGLEAMLADLYATAPDTWLEVEEVVGSGDLVMARVAVHHDPGATFLGLSVLANPSPWGAVDVLRVKEGEVSERRGLLIGTGLLRTIGLTPLGLDGPTRRVVTLERVAIPPGSPYDDHGSGSLGPHLLLVESGTIRFERNPAQPGEPVGIADLSPGAMVVLPASSGFVATNTGGADAALVRLSFNLAQPGGAAMGSSGAPATGETTTRVLAGGVAALLPDGPLAVSVGRVLLAPGAMLSLAGGAGVTLVSVEVGRSTIAVDGSARVRRGSDGSGTSVASTNLGPGDGVLVETGTPLVLRNDGTDPAEFLVLVIAPILV